MSSPSSPRNSRLRLLFRRADVAGEGAGQAEQQAGTHGGILVLGGAVPRIAASLDALVAVGEEHAVVCCGFGEPLADQRGTRPGRKRGPTLRQPPAAAILNRIGPKRRGRAFKSLKRFGDMRCW